MGRIPIRRVFILSCSFVFVLFAVVGPAGRVRATVQIALRGWRNDNGRGVAARRGNGSFAFEARAAISVPPHLVLTLTHICGAESARAATDAEPLSLHDTQSAGPIDAQQMGPASARHKVSLLVS